jgi:drug/metabolite transporter (DMT)-like permease
VTAFWAIVLALASNVVLSLGMLLQKKYVAVFGTKDRRSAAFRRDLLGWILGFLLMNLAPIPRFFALQGLPINVVNAFVGSNVAFTAIMAVFILKERMTRPQILWSAFLLAALALAAARGGSPESALDRPSLIFFFALPLVLGALCMLLRRRKPSRELAILFAVSSGAFGGYMNLPMKAVQSGGLDIATLVFFVGLYIVAGALSFVLIQFAYKDGEMSAVSPAMYGLQVLWPALASFWVFRSLFDPVQVLALVAIALGVLMIAKPARGAPPPQA